MTVSRTRPPTSGPLLSRSGHPGLGERGDLELVRGCPRALIREEQDRVGDLAGISERLACAIAATSPAERFDSRVHDQERDMDARSAQLERGGLRDRTDAEGTGGPQPATRHRAARRAAR